MRIHPGALCLLAFALALAPSLAASAKPETLAELQQEIEKVLEETRTPGAAIAIVKRDGPEWVAGLGLADVAQKKPVTADTLFRIGSVSKGFASLAVLKLQQEGRLSLDDTLRSRAPELVFSNPWEATDPVRIVHLLEHTSGWDDMALREYVYAAPNEMSLQAGLAYDPRSRTSRWKPGTRFSYCNSGPAAAAYVVEKITGQRFEDYVEQTWFKPLGMTTASYLNTPAVRERLTNLYYKDGRTPVPYWYILLRPAGSINASAKDMANYVQFYLNRGAFAGQQLLPSEAIDRMEEPRSSYAAREGLRAGYGLGNYATVRARVFHGHNGGVIGGLSEMSYLPNEGVGFVVMINSGSGTAMWRIDGLIRAYVAKDWPTPTPPPVATAAADVVQAYAGWYEPISPRVEVSRAVLRIAGLMRLSHRPDGLSLRGLFNRQRNFVAVTDRLYRRPNDGAATVALIADESEGRLIVANGQTFRRIAAWTAWSEIMLAGLGVLAMLSSAGFALVWLPRKLLGRMKEVAGISVRAMPALATLSLASAGLLLGVSSEEMIERFGQITPWSIGLVVSIAAFAGFAVLGLVLALAFYNRPIRRWVWWHAFTASLVLSTWAVYLSAWGLVGRCPWA